MDSLFPEQEPVKAEKGLTCRTCEHRERWQCGGSVIQYCGVRKSRRTDNGLLKIKVTMPACPVYKEQQKGGQNENENNSK